MGHSNPPRRVLRVADPVDRSQQLARSPGWTDDGTADQVVRLLDTDSASTQVDDVAGFFPLGGDDWAVARGGLAGAPNPTGRYWRGALALGADRLARFRGNPFRLLATISADPPRSQAEPLRPPRLPNDATGDDDARRLTELVASAPSHGADLRSTLAAVLEAEHTIVFGSTLTLEDIELMVLLLPPGLRCTLTFHSCATSLPREPVPRLVSTHLASDWPFEADRPLWGHRLPRSADSIEPRAIGVAEDLLRLAETPVLLVRAHEAWERMRLSAGDAPAPLLDELESVLHFARVDAAIAQRDLACALAVIGDVVRPAEGVALSDVLENAVSPVELGCAVAEAVRHGVNLPGAVAVMHRRFALRDEDPEAYEAFADSVSVVVEDASLRVEDESVRRILTMLMLRAAAAGDSAAFVSSLVVPIDGDVVRSLGGLAQWRAVSGDGIGAELRLFHASADPDATLEALRGIASLSVGIPPGPRRQRLIERGVDFVRRCYGELPAEQWASGLPVSAMLVSLCDVVTSSGGAGLDGRTETDHVRDVIERRIDAATLVEHGRQTAGELFIGFLGVAASPSHLARWEVAGRGRDLVGEIRQRISGGREGTEQAVAEAVHWSMALLDRVRREQVDPEHAALAGWLLARGAPESASSVLRAWCETHPEMVPLLAAQAPIGEMLGEADLAPFHARAVASALAEAVRTCDVEIVARVAEPMQAAGVHLGTTDLAPIEGPLRRLVGEMRSRSIGRRDEGRITALHDVLLPLVTREARSALASMLDEHGRAPRRAPAAGAAESVSGERSEAAEPAAPTVPDGAPIASPEVESAATPGPAGDEAVEDTPVASVAGRRPRTTRRVLVAAVVGGAIVVAGATTVALLQRRSAADSPPGVRIAAGSVVGGVSSTGASEIPSPAVGASSPATAAADAPREEAPAGDAGEAPARPYASVLADALRFASSGSATEAIELLTADTVPIAQSEAFTWDSLLARTALGVAVARPPGDDERNDLLRLVLDRATRALEAVTPFAAGTEQVRLTRAEACLAAPSLECSQLAVTEDLLFATRSRDARISARASALLAEHSR